MLKRHYRDLKESSYFIQYASDITSQGGEDGIITHIFHLLPQKSRRYCVDIGAWDGKHLSNTYNLLYNQSTWDGALFEANESRVSTLIDLYASKSKESSQTIQCIHTLVNFEGENSLNNLLFKYNVPYDFDFLSIDVDGNDYHLWKCLSKSPLSVFKHQNSAESHKNQNQSVSDRYRPILVCIEFNPTIPNDIIFVQEPDIRVQQGSSLRALIDLGYELQYTFIVATTFNAFFIRNDYNQYLPKFDNSIDKLHSASMATTMFQTYDGEIKLAGPKKLLWHRKAINPQKFQVLSKHERKFPFAPPYDDQLDRLYQMIHSLLIDCLSWYDSEETLSIESIDKIFKKISNLLIESFQMLPISHLVGVIDELIIQVVYVIRYVLGSLLFHQNYADRTIRQYLCHHIEEALYIIALCYMSRGVRLMSLSSEDSSEYCLQAWSFITCIWDYHNNLTHHNPYSYDCIEPVSDMWNEFLSTITLSYNSTASIEDVAMSESQSQERSLLINTKNGNKIDERYFNEIYQRERSLYENIERLRRLIPLALSILSYDDNSDPSIRSSHWLSLSKQSYDVINSNNHSVTGMEEYQRKLVNRIRNDIIKFYKNHLFRYDEGVLIGDRIKDISTVMDIESSLSDQSTSSKIRYLDKPIPEHSQTPRSISSNITIVLIISFASLCIGIQVGMIIGRRNLQ